MTLNILASERRSSVSVLFAAAALPMLGVVGLAIDFGIWNQTNSALSVAANVAAMTAAKIAANAQLAGDSNAFAEGKVAGQQWFLAEIGSQSAIGTTGTTLVGSGATVTVTGGTTLTATVKYDGTVPSIFGGIFAHLASYPIHGQAVAVVASAPFLNVEIMLDNSGSMEIGASINDIIALQEYTPCQVGAPGAGAHSPGAIYTPGGNLADQGYGNYQTSGYTGSIPTPAMAQPGLGVNTYVVGSTGQSCKGVALANSDGSYPTAGPPCAFACHFDYGPGRPPAGSGDDFYAIARQFAGKPNQINLRFDLVKNATNQVISTMKMDNIASINNLQVGVFTFADNLLRVYPDPTCATGPTCEAGLDFDTAIADVGSPPNVPYGPDTGIQPYSVAANNGTGNTDFDTSMTTLAGLLTPSGDGTTATSPRKVLFLITDGLLDANGKNGRHAGGVPAADCDLFKQMGYSVYVVFTPYYPVMNNYYIGNVKPLVEPLNTSTAAQAMQACSSDPVNDYVSATDQTGLANALQKFLKSALTQPARFTM